MDKTRVRDFDQRVCRGEAAGVNGPCPYLATADGETGRPVVDALARAEGSLLSRLTGREQFKCGACGCPLANLGALGFVPGECPRTALHDE